jgi:hypothetical protein
MNNNVNIKKMYFRLREFTMFQLTIVFRENYGTLSTDWRNDIVKKKKPLNWGFFYKGFNFFNYHIW